MSIADEFIRQWELFRSGTIAELELIPEEQWSERPGEKARTVRALARHVLEAGAGFTHELLREDGSFAHLFEPGFREEIRKLLPQVETKAEILEALRSNGADNFRRLREAGEMLANTPMTSGKGTQSRLTGILFAASHEQYHRGQIAMVCRLLGHVPALTTQIEKIKSR